MVIDTLKTTAAAVLVVAATTITLAAGKPPKPVTSVPATVTFRCFGVGSSDPASPCFVSDDGTVAVAADHVGDEGIGAYAQAVVGARFFLRLTGTGRALRLFLHPALGTSRTDECGAEGALAACSSDTTLTALNGASVLLDQSEISIAVLNPTAPYDDAAGGLTGMACGRRELALVAFTAWLPSGNGHWGLNFNKRAYHSTGASITRTTSTTWVVEATVDDTAELVSFGHTNIARKSGPSHEGQYTVPFQLTIDSGAALPTGATSCPTN